MPVLRVQFKLLLIMIPVVNFLPVVPVSLPGPFGPDLRVKMKLKLRLMKD